MWESIFVLDTSAVEKLIRTALLYAFLLVALRLSGKRLMAQLTTFDFILLLLVSNTVQNGLIGDDDSVTGAVLGAAALFLLNGALAYLLFRSRRAEKIVVGRSSVVIRDGVLDEEVLAHERFTHSDLKVALQEAGATRIKDVKLARLEPNGQILVHLREKKHGPSHAELLAAIEALTAKVDALSATPGKAES